MYEAYSDYESMMNMAEDIVTRCALGPLQLMGNLELITRFLVPLLVFHFLSYLTLTLIEGIKLYALLQGVEICLERPWRRETMHNLVKEAGIDFKNFGDDLNAAKEHDIKQLIFLVMIWIRVQLKQCSSVGHLHNEVFEMVVEPKLLQPTIVLE
ncbi:hypothetical protein MTR67_048018 [Solanum verrucosum]|uniref:Uncharacterized protein n=1 Tax=Solanum verrucosum TaxID=315347 RepID=A0AAF0ZYS6_SOLVR|nr:hypothetical protein MTR67_048018 [Solanum verrucosum]